MIVRSFTLGSLAVVIVLLAGAAPSHTAVYGIGRHGWRLPNDHITPGKTVEISTKKVCETKGSKDVRHVTLSMKHEVCMRYGAHSCPGPHWEIDHRISRELGGADDVENLWPQPIIEARKKDTLENFLHRAVCTEAITLERAQEILRDDWTKYYDKMHGEGHGLTFGKPFGQ